MKIQNAHDKYFKESFSKVEIARDFLDNYLSSNIMKVIDLNTLKPEKDSFINEELKEVFSDLLYSVKINNKQGYIYFLFEHKSYVSKNVAFQLLRYMIEIWETKVKKESVNELPMIIPLVIYHGKDTWNIRRTLGEMITGYKDFPKEVQKFIPDYEYILYDISGYTDEEIKGQAMTKVVLTAFRDIFAKDHDQIVETVLKVVDYLRVLEDKQTGIEYFETFIRYILNAGQSLDKADVEKIVKKLETNYPEGSEKVMTFAEKIREEGEIIGEKRGESKGERNALVNTATRLLIKKFGVIPKEFKEGISKLDSDTLEIIIDGIFEYEDLDDVKKYIF